MSILENDVIKLRALEPEDAELLYIWENDANLWQFGETLMPFSRHTLSQYATHAPQDIYDAKQLRLMIDTKDEIPVTVGTIDLFDFNPHHKRAGIGILVYDEQNRKKGYATEALRLLIRYSFDLLQLHQLYCNVAATNEKSIALFRNCGFEIAGIKREWLLNNKKWMDECTLQLINPQY